MTPTGRRAARAATAALVVLALAIAGIGGFAATHHRRTVAAVTVTRTTTARSVPLPRPTRAAGAPPDATAVVAQVASLAVYASPGGSAGRRLANPTDLGSPLVLLVTGAEPGWWEVSLPIRPNGSRGWVRAVDVALRAVPYQLTVAQHTHTVVLWKDGVRVRAFPIAIGAPSTPSPDGLFSINEIIDNRSGDQAYGPWVMGLSGFSNVYTTFGGGDAAVALHGTDEDASVGTSASHGCFRMHDADATTLAHLVTLGTPVYVTP